MSTTHLPPNVNATVMTATQYDGVRKFLDNNGSRAIRPAGDALKLLEEVLELCYASGAYVVEVDQVVASETLKAAERRQIEGRYYKGDSEEEVGDVSLCLAAYIQKHEIDSQRCVQEALNKVNKREWAVDMFGVLRRPDRNPYPYKEK